MLKNITGIPRPEEEPTITTTEKNPTEPGTQTERARSHYVLKEEVVSACAHTGTPNTLTFTLPVSMYDL